ncbi:uncharacterized protein LOC115918147 [Strongylocentrotus purpuratus]|uniref:Syntaxin-5 N-terminal Sly1p-binding domain-containing protein n=1 Tax=Strongylocentrotus purpuratus TaxID=7668 RepID=A0A7M7P6U1_STRPU|nr:uncharacterized protein LOC115926549 [Strongylocentrotus purpuratus]XP_030848061.1 uncharacterized protein LOC115918147 [Strongylocentrotus purpuratus]
MASVVKTLSLCLCLIAFVTLEIKAQTTDRTSEFQALCDRYRTVMNDCEEKLPGLVTADEQALLNSADNNQVCLEEEGETNFADACEILESVCIRVVSCPASARFRRSSSVSASAESSVESSETD